MASRPVLLFVLGLSLSLFVALAPIPVQGQEPKKVLIKVAVIDVDAIRRNAAAAKDIRTQIGKLRAAFQAEIEKEEEELRNANQELARQRTILSPEAFAEERRKFEQRLAEVQRTVQERKRDLQKARGTAMNEVQKALAEVVAKLAGEQGITLLLRKDQTVLVAKALEITALILARLDEKLPTVVVPTPEKAGK